VSEKISRRNILLGGLAALTLMPIETYPYTKRMTPEDFIKFIKYTALLYNVHMTNIQDALYKSGMVSYVQLSKLETLRTQMKITLEEKYASNYTMTHTPYPCFPRLSKYIKKYFRLINRLLRNDFRLRAYLHSIPSPDDRYDNFLAYLYVIKSASFELSERYVKFCK